MSDEYEDDYPDDSVPIPEVSAIQPSANPLFDAIHQHSIACGAITKATLQEALDKTIVQCKISQSSTHFAINKFILLACLPQHSALYYTLLSSGEYETLIRLADTAYANLTKEQTKTPATDKIVEQMRQF